MAEFVPPKVVLPPPSDPIGAAGKPAAPALAPSGSAERLLTSITPDVPRNDLGGYYGVQFTPNTTMVFNKIGIRAGALGLTEPRSVTIQESATQVGVARALVDLSVATSVDDFCYTDIPEITLSAGVAYDLFGLEFPGDGHSTWNQTPCVLRDCSSWASIGGWAGYASGLGLSGYSYTGIDLDYGTPNTVFVPGNDYWDTTPGAEWTSNTTFTLDRLTAYPIVNATASWSRSTFSHSTGKWHVEDTVIQLSPGTHVGVGFAARFIDWGDLDQAFYVFNSSYAAIRVGYNDVLALPAAFYKPGDTPNKTHVALEVDFDAKTMRVNNLTNGSGWSDPADISTLTGSAWFFSIGHLGNGVQTDQDTINFGGSPFAVPLSPGYAAWAPFTAPPVTGTLTRTQFPQTLSATGNVLVAGALTQTQAPQTLSAAGKVLVSGVLNQLQAPNTLSATAMVGQIGILAATEAGDTAALTGQLAWQATLAATEAGDVAAFVATVRWLGTLAATEAGDTFSATGTVATTGIIGGSLAATEAADAAVFAGQVTGVGGVLAASEASDTAAFVATVRWLGTLAATEAPDAAAFVGAVRTAGVLAAIEAGDTANFTSFAADTIVAVLAAVEARDTASFVGGISTTGVLAATEASDRAAFKGTVFGVITGHLAASEGADTAYFTSRPAIDSSITSCCPPPLCGNDLCCTFVAFINQMPTGPAWDYWKQAAISYFQSNADPAECPLLHDPACPSLILHAIYCVLKLKSLVHDALWPAFRESNPATAITTLDAHLARMQWEDCYRQHCRGALSDELTPYEVMSPCGPLFCDPDIPPELENAVKRGVAIALTRANMGIIKNLDGLNWVIELLGAQVLPVYPPLVPTNPIVKPCDSKCLEPVAFQICHNRDWLPGLGTGDVCEQLAPPQVQAWWDWGCDRPAGLPEKIWPGVLAAECIVRSMMPVSCPSNISRCC